MAKLIQLLIAVNLTVLFAGQQSVSAASAPAPAIVWSSTGVRSEAPKNVLPRMNYLLSLTPDDIASLRPILDNELNINPIYKAAWDEGTQIFQTRKVNLVDPGFQNIPDEYHIALIAYTLHDTPQPKAFYSDFNTKTRLLTDAQADMQNFPYKSFFKLLHLAIQSLSKDPKFQHVQPLYWRGASLRFALTVGQEIAFQQYTSTTIDKSQAEVYAKGTTMFEFTGPIPNSIYLFYHSGFPAEQEILVSPLTTYNVTNIDFGFGGPYTKHSLICTNV